MRLWRLMRPQYAPGLDGLGAKRFGGRWNSIGTPMVYCSGSVALATLETFVHLPVAMRSPEKLPELSLVTLEVPEGASVKTYSVPDVGPAPTNELLKQIGDDWIFSRESLCLRVPSLVVPSDQNVLINPEHSEFQSVEVIAVEPFSYDPRMTRG